MTATVADPHVTLADPVIFDDDLDIGSHHVPDDLRRMRTIDVSVLWFNLSIGILVIAAGALLATPTGDGGLGLRIGPALLAIMVGTIGGSLLLAAVAGAAHQTGLPSMAMLRRVIGRQGSYVASVLNIAQLVGWTAFEFWAMSEFASRVSDRLFGSTMRGLWLVVVAAICLGLSLLGPLRVVRLFLERVATWVLAGTCLYLTIYLVAKGGVGPVWGSNPGGSGFAVAVDLVIAMPVSWLSVIADYNRFARTRAQSFTGTFSGYGIGNAWLYGLGVLLVLAGRVVDSSPAGIAAGVLGLSSGVVIGVLLLAGLVAGETPNAFADIYSAAVSATNVFARLSVRAVSTIVCVVAVVLAAVVHLGDYETFLFLLGSFFVPLFAVVLADHLTNHRPRDRDPSVRVSMIACWALGFIAYQWILPTGPAWWTGWVLRHVAQAGRLAWLGASLPSFTFTFLIAAVANTLGRPRTGQQGVQLGRERG